MLSINCPEENIELGLVFEVLLGCVWFLLPIIDKFLSSSSFVLITLYLTH